MSKLDLAKLNLLSAALLLVLVLAVLIRGGGYSIAGLRWDTHLVVRHSSLRIGPYTVEPGDRIKSVNSRQVERDADLRGALRALEADEIWLEVERRDHRVAVPLTPEAIANNELPAVLRGPYRVVRIDDQEVEGDMNLAVMASWMDMNGGQPAVFTVSVPDYSFEGPALRQQAHVPMAPVLVGALGLAMALLAWLRGQSEVMSRLRDHWHLLGIALSSGAALLAYLLWPEGFMADPVLLPFALVALALWRPLSLLLHQGQRTELHGPTARYFRLGVVLPASILLLAGMYGWLRTQLGSAQRIDGFVFDQLRLLVLVAAAAIAAYHLADLGLQAAELRGRRRSDPVWRWPPFWGGVLGAGCLVTAGVSLFLDPEAFTSGGFGIHLTGLVGLQWLGDMALLPRRARPAELRATSAESEPRLAEGLRRAQAMLGVADPRWVVRRSGADVVLSLAPPEAEAGEGDDESVPAAPRLEPHWLDERLAGLLELLDAEGGMFPRYKTFIGRDEVPDDPFEGLDRAVGVALVLPIDPPEGVDPTLRAYLVSPRAEDEADSVPPDAEAVASWQRWVEGGVDLWPELRAAAAEGALQLLRRQPAATPPLEGAPAAPSESPPAAPSQAVPAKASAPPAPAKPSAPPGPTPQQRAILHYREEDATQAYPSDEPDLLDAEDLARLEPFVARAGALAIIGPPGSGRELSARWLHAQWKPQAGFFTLNCSTLPEALLLAELEGEGELPGRLVAAQNGTLCLRDASTVSEETQEQVLSAIKAAPVRLVLIETVYPDESDRDLPPPLQRVVDEAMVRLPPLARRVESITRATHYYVHRFAMEFGRVVTAVDEDALAWLLREPWPANYLSLIGCLRDAVLRSVGPTLTLADLALRQAAPAPTNGRPDAAPADGPQGEPARAESPRGDTPLHTDLARSVEDLERDAVMQALDRSAGNKSEAARLLGMKRTTFIRKLAKYAPER